jgi:hypothetical protein
MAILVVAFLAIVASTIAVAIAVLCYRPAGFGAPRGARGLLRFVSGPFPLSVAMHVAVLLFLIVTVHTSRGRELILVNLEAGGGGGGGSEMQDLDLPEVPMPDIAPQQFDAPQTAAAPEAVALAEDYVRAAVGGIGTARGGGVGGSYGDGFDNGFPGFVVKLRRTGLEAVLVIDGTGSMNLIIDDVKARMRELVMAIQKLVPTARIGIVVYGGRGEPVDMQPLTISPTKLVDFLGRVQAKGGGEWEEDTLGGLQAAIEKMDWHAYSRKVIVLVGDSPPRRDDFAPILALIRKFRAENGILNTVDVTALEHERFERALSLKVHRTEAARISALPAFALQSEVAFKALAQSGGGTMKALGHDRSIDEQVLVLVFGDKWEDQVALFGRGMVRLNTEQSRSGGP